jgi:hypothetical protein
LIGIQRIALKRIPASRKEDCLTNLASPYLIVKSKKVRRMRSMAVGSPLLGVSFSSAFIFVAQKRPHGARTACDDDISMYTRMDRRYL